MKVDASTMTAHVFEEQCENELIEGSARKCSILAQIPLLKLLFTFVL